MKYVVTGVAGFIASHVAQALLNHGHEVIGIDDFSSGLKSNVPEGVKLVVCDLANEADVTSNLDAFKSAAGVFHLAADARIQPSIECPRACIDNNVQSTLNVLEAMRHHKVKRIVYSASSSVYGRINALPYGENDKADPLNAYAASKLMGEVLCQAYDSCYNIEHVSLRYFNVFGERSPVHIGAYSPVVGLFFTQALKNEPLTVVGNGMQSRDFTFVDDVVTANIKAMEMKQLLDEMKLLNIGSGAQITILDLARMINEICGKPSDNITFLPARHGEAHFTKAQNFKSLFRLGVEYTPLRQALHKLKPHYESVVCA